MASSKFTIDLIQTEEDLIQKMTDPSPELKEAVAQIDGDIMILGTAGKMGLTLAELLVKAGAKGVIGVDLFPVASDRDYLESKGVRTEKCDLTDDESLNKLPDAGHILLLAGTKFGSSANEPFTWAMNTFLPARIVQKFSGSKIVYVSSGNVYRFVPPESGGATESSPVDPIGEYAQSRLGGERLVAFHSERGNTPVAIVRLFYATELRYGIILDIAQKLWERQPIDLAMGHVNQIWQGDTISYLARCFPLCESPARIINLTGPELLSVREVAASLSDLMGVDPVFEGRPSETALLGDSKEIFSLLGPPKVMSDEIVQWVANWVMIDGPTLGKPTKFQARDGKF